MEGARNARGIYSGSSQSGKIKFKNSSCHTVFFIMKDNFKIGVTELLSVMLGKLR